MDKWLDAERKQKKGRRRRTRRRRRKEEKEERVRLLMVSIGYYLLGSEISIPSGRGEYLILKISTASDIEERYICR